ncbi:response regulator (plasmid) [Deinococcus radiomollis]
MIVDDNPADLYLAEEAIQSRGLPCSLHLMPSATAALNFLAEADPLPDLMLVDVNMPGMNGLDLLQQVKADPARQHLKVVMFTTSDSERDQQQARVHRADGYVVKSQSFTGFQAQLETLLHRHATG